MISPMIIRQKADTNAHIRSGRRSLENCGVYSLAEEYIDENLTWDLGLRSWVLELCIKYQDQK